RLDSLHFVSTPPRESTMRLCSSSLLLPLCLIASTAHPQQTGWRPTPGHPQLPIWTGAIPDAAPVLGSETVEISGPNDLIGGKRTTGVRNVTIPTMTIYSPAGRNTGASVVVFPGGGYQMLAIDLEGTEVCDWLVPRGITCIVLKYRVPGNPRLYPKSGPYPESPMALEDAQRTIGLLRLHAAEYHINPHRIGVLGFSAGGSLVADISNHFDRRIYHRIDAADDQSCRPDFAIAIYPGHLSYGAAGYDVSQSSNKTFTLPPNNAPPAVRDLILNPHLRVTKNTPPTFLLQNEDDHVDNVDDALSYYIALKNAGVPTELHLYPKGGHAFGLRRTKLPVTAWPQLVDTWLAFIGMTPQ
ncbi:MAG TPA: alpha/beta hydrolase, partial [Acidobacteriaceae bacterium]|nr:alpha/beta hydrolase [Acidobacteriaceae bacterium]